MTCQRPLALAWVLLCFILAAAHGIAAQELRVHACSGSDPCSTSTYGSEVSNTGMRTHPAGSTSSSSQQQEQGFGANSFAGLVNPGDAWSAASPLAVIRKLLVSSKTFGTPTDQQAAAHWSSLGSLTSGAGTAAATAAAEAALQPPTAVTSAAGSLLTGAAHAARLLLNSTAVTAGNTTGHNTTIANTPWPDIVYVHYQLAGNGLVSSVTGVPDKSPLKINATNRCDILRGRGLTVPWFYASENFGWSGLSCCYLLRWTITLLSQLGNCTGVVVAAQTPPEMSLKEWLQQLPTNITGLDLWGNALHGSLPEAFVAGNKLEVLFLGNNRFAGPLPDSWGSTLTQLRTLDLSGGNRFSGTLPWSWGGGRDMPLQYFRCTTSACDNITGEFPLAWRNMPLKYLLLSEGTKLEGQLPWAVYQLEGKSIFSRDSPDVLVFGRGSTVDLPDDLCLYRGSNDLAEDSKKLYTILGEKWLDIRADPSATFTNWYVEKILDELGSYNLSDYGEGLCVASNRYLYIAIVYGIFVLLLLGTVVYVLCPSKWFQCSFNNLLPSQAAAGSRSAKLTQVSFVMLLAGKGALVLFDIGSDFYAAWTLRDAKLYLGLYLGVLFAPNVIAGFVLHLRLCYLTKRQQLVNEPASCTFSLYGWLYAKGGGALLYASTLLLWPYWCLGQVPLLFVATVTHAKEKASESTSKKACCVRARWFHGIKYCVLLSFLVACIEAPFSAIVFTVHYARGMTADFPIVVSTKAWLLTAGSALLHIALEVFMLAASYKKGTLRSDVQGYFTGMVRVGEQAASAESPVGHGEESGLFPGSNDAEMVFDNGGETKRSRAGAVQLCRK